MSTIINHCITRLYSVVSDSLQPHGLLPARTLCLWDFAGKNTGVGCHFLLLGIFLTQGLNPGLPHYRQMLYYLSHQGSHITFWKRQNYGCRESISGHQGMKQGRMNRQSREIFTAVKVLDAYYPNFVKPIECVRSREKSLFLSWVIMMYQRRFINCNKCTTLLGDVDKEGGGAYAGSGVYRKLLYFSLSFAVNLKLL